MILTLDKYQSGRYKLPHSAPAPNESDNTEDITMFIDRYERELLVDALGVDLYNDIKDNKADFNAAPDEVKRLVKGYDYTLDDGTKVSWNGLDNSESLLIPYVYYRYLQDQQDIMTTFGVERPQGVNSEAVSSIPRVTAAYRDFFEKYQSVDNGVAFYSSPYISGIDYLGSKNIRRSLYQFLCDNDYDISHFKLFENTNQFGV